MKTQIPWQSVPPIKKLPQASYPSPSDGRQNENHNHRKLTKLITWITALSDSMKLWAMPCRATQDGSWWRVLTKHGPLENGMANHSSILALSMNSMKRQKDKTLKDELPRSVGAQYITGDQWRNNSRKNEETEPKWKKSPVVDMTGDGSKVWCCKEQCCIGTWNVRSMNQSKLEVVKQEMAKVNTDILGISELKWTRMGESKGKNPLEEME